MARRRGLPQGTLDTLLDETADARAKGASAVVDHDPLPLRARARKARKAIPPYTTRASRRVPPEPKVLRGAAAWETDPVSRYAASRGLPVVSGAVPALRLAMQYVMDVREVAKKERTNVLSVLSKALAGYLNAYDRS